MDQVAGLLHLARHVLHHVLLRLELRVQRVLLRLQVTLLVLQLRLLLRQLVLLHLQPVRLVGEHVDEVLVALGGSVQDLQPVVEIRSGGRPEDQLDRAARALLVRHSGSCVQRGLLRRDVRLGLLDVLLRLQDRHLRVGHLVLHLGDPRGQCVQLRLEDRLLGPGALDLLQQGIQLCLGLTERARPRLRSQQREQQREHDDQAAEHPQFGGKGGSEHVVPIPIGRAGVCQRQRRTSVLPPSTIGPGWRDP